MKNLLLTILLGLLFTLSSHSQTMPNKAYRVFDGNGKPSSIKRIMRKLRQTDVVFLGENHDDSVAHKLEFEIFKNAFEYYGKKRNVVLSLEMFERDVQIVVNEYLSGLISEKHFLASSRPWGNYKTDYRPLVEFAKENKLEVIAANAPRRYVNMVSRLGRKSLDKLSPDAKKWLPPLPYGQPSEKYAKKFNALMGGHGSARILGSQSLWDASMSNSIAESFKRNENNLVVHLNGAFHTESRMGTVEHLLKYRPGTRILVVTMRYVKDFKRFDMSKHKGIGDFVILTDAAQPRSKR